MIGGKELIDISDKMGVLESVKNKLIGQPDKASDRLTAALEELLKIFSAFEVQIVRFLAISFDPNDKAQLKKDRQILIEFEGGALKAEMNKARGRCGKIWNIYARHLTPWFKDALNKHEAKTMRALFLSMTHVDGEMLRAIESINDWLQAEVDKVSTFVDGGKFDDANQTIAQARKDVLSTRRAMSDATRKLFDIEADFIEMSGAV